MVRKKCATLKGDAVDGWSQRNDLADGKTCLGMAVVWGCIIIIALVLDALGYHPISSCLLSVLGGILGYSLLKAIQSLWAYFSKKSEL
ncbi:MAG: hypothetical protein KGZ25_00890 [Planctomycetes bacterium]|nr:hypothetical protein [Planctomycetota bacterium]